MRCLAVLAASLLAAAAADAVPASALFYEGFQGGDLGAFVKSKAPKYAGQPVAVEAPKLAAGVEGDLGLVLQQAAKHYAVAAQLPEPVSGEGGLVVQYEVRFQEGLQCGGAYVKLLNATSSLRAATVDSDTPYAIMFGPDRCGGTDKVHLIIRWRNPVDGSIEEKHLADAPKPPVDAFSHVYTLVLRPDDTYTIKIDNVAVRDGSLASATAFKPSILPTETIDDPTDIKPSDWVDDAKIADPLASKPDDWDEDAPSMIEDAAAVKPAGWLDDAPDHVPDPDAQKPEDWDDDEDGEWEAPMVENPACKAAPGCGVWKRPVIRNPAFKGKWSPPMIDNPAYIGPWKPRQVPNAAYFTDDHLHLLSGARIGGVAVEVWTMQGGLMFDNFLITREEADASSFAAASWRPKHDAQVAFTDKSAREQRRAERLEAYSKGGALDKFGFYVAEAVDLATDHPLYAVAAVLATAIAGIAGCFFMMSSPTGSSAAADAAAAAAEEAEEAAAAAAEEEAHGHSHAHGHHGHSHGHSHGGEEDSDAEADEADEAAGAGAAAAGGAVGDLLSAAKAAASAKGDAVTGKATAATAAAPAAAAEPAPAPAAAAEPAEGTARATGVASPATQVKQRGPGKRGARAEA